MKVVIIGAGNIGGAIARRLVIRRVVKPSQLLLIDRNQDQLNIFQNELGCGIALNLESISKESVVFLAVKPQEYSNLPLLCKTDDNPLVISVMAGITIEHLEKHFNLNGRVVRCMPNLPSQVGEGFTVYSCNQELVKSDIHNTELFLSVLGTTLFVEDESLLDAATAISGSGPGYLFYIIGLFLETAEEMGFSPGQADLMIEKTLLGAVKLWSSSSSTAQQLCKMVSSKGGTTEAALSTFRDKGFDTSLKAGIREALKRSKELSAS